MEQTCDHRKAQGSREAALLSEYQSTYAMFLTQMSQMTLLLRTSLETHELQKVRETLKAGSDGEAVANTNIKARF
jgi:hypothetical protein